MQLSGSLVLIYYYYDNCVAITELVDQWDSYYNSTNPTPSHILAPVKILVTEYNHTFVYNFLQILFFSSINLWHN